MVEKAAKRSDGRDRARYQVVDDADPSVRGGTGGLLPSGLDVQAK